MIVNKPENLKPRILIKDLGLRNAEIIRMLDDMVKPGYHQGIKRDGYYMLAVTGIIRIDPRFNAKLIQMLFSFISACNEAGFTYLMLKF